MARRDRLQELAAERGVTTEWYIKHIVVPMVNVKGQGETARELGVSQATVSRWLKGKFVLIPMWMQKSPRPEGAA